MLLEESYINERLDHLGIVAGVCQEIGLASCQEIGLASPRDTQRVSEEGENALKNWQRRQECVILR